MDAKPKFKTVGKPPFPVTVYLLCSAAGCETEIRAMSPREEIKVNRGHYCPAHDDGAVHLNMPSRSE